MKAGVVVNKVIITLSFILVLSGAVLASPNIQILSPQNTTYSDYGPILINVSSNETVDFNMKAKTGRNIILAANKTVYESSIYGSLGSYNFTISANNSNGVVSTSVRFTINHSSIINVTGCGALFSSNTTYVLQNNISSSANCIFLAGKDNTFDLNGYSITGGFIAIFAECYNGNITNGNIIGGSSTGILISGGSKCLVKNLTIEAQSGMEFEFFSSSLLERIRIKNPAVGISFVSEANNIVMRNLTLETNKPDGIAFKDFNFYSSMNLEASRIENFTHAFYFGVDSSDWYLKNNILDISRVKPDSEISTAVRLFKEHLLKINVSDITGKGIPASIELLDNGALRRTNREENIYTLRSNPTGHIFEGTDPNGLLETFVTERLITYKSASPLSSEEFAFGPYNITARSGNSSVTNVNVSVNLNSTLTSNFTIVLPTELPQCTIAQMLDLNYDGVVNAQDARIILRFMVGKPLTVNSTKQCNALNFLPLND